MRRIIIFALLGVVAFVVLVTPAASAGSYSASSPSPPSGYTQTYAHNFASQGRGDWVTQPGAGATVEISNQFGLGVEVTDVNQWAEVVSSGAVVGPNSFVKALVYIPAGPHGYTADWPAWYTAGTPWPQGGEIDILEGQHGYSCEQTHYGTSAQHESNSASDCAALGGVGLGWVTVSMLRTGGKVTVWYGATKMGTVALPVSSNQQLIFQNQDRPDSCCNGPLVYPSTAWLSRVTVWSKGH